MIQFTIIDALNKLLPNVEWNLIDNDLKTLEILSDSNVLKPTQKQVDDAVKALENEYQTEQTNKATAKAALLAKLGISEDEAKLLLS
jgi:hypothetical protein